MHTPESSLTGNVHGMPLAHLVDHGDPAFRSIAGFEPAVRPVGLVLVGLRDFDVPEREAIRWWGLTAYLMRGVDELGDVASLMNGASADEHVRYAAWGRRRLGVTLASQAAADQAAL